MKISATEVQSKTKDIELDLKATYKEPDLTITVDGLEVLKLTIAAETLPSASGANDILSLHFSLSESESLTKQIHLPTFKIEQKLEQEEAATQPTTGA